MNRERAERESIRRLRSTVDYFAGLERLGARARMQLADAMNQLHFLHGITLAPVHGIGPHLASGKPAA